MFIIRSVLSTYLVVFMNQLFSHHYLWVYVNIYIIYSTYTHNDFFWFMANVYLLSLIQMIIFALEYTWMHCFSFLSGVYCCSFNYSFSCLFPVRSSSFRQSCSLIHINIVVSLFFLGFFGKFNVPTFFCLLSYAILSFQVKVLYLCFSWQEK